MKRLTREWIGKAEDDYQAAHRLRDENRRFHDQICFHCQQSAEKYLKAVLQEAGVRFDRTHDLERLLIVLLPAHTRLRGLRRGLKFLRRFAVETRYPGDRATKRDAGGTSLGAAGARGLPSRARNSAAVSASPPSRLARHSGTANDFVLETRCMSSGRHKIGTGDYHRVRTPHTREFPSFSARAACKSPKDSPIIDYAANRRRGAAHLITAGSSFPFG